MGKAILGLVSTLILVLGIILASGQITSDSSNLVGESGKEPDICADGACLNEGKTNISIKFQENTLLSDFEKSAEIKKEQYDRLIKPTISFNQKAKKDFIDLDINFTIVNQKGFIKTGRGYNVVGTQYVYIPFVSCDLYNSTSDIYDSIVLGYQVFEFKGHLIINARGSLDITKARSFNCSDPLVNGQTPIVGYVNQDGASSTQHQPLIDLWTNNNITNYTWINIGAQWSNLTATTYDQFVDVYYIGDKFMGDNNNGVQRLNGTHKGLFINGDSYLDNFGLCAAADDFVGSQVNMINVSDSIWNASTGWNSGIVTVYPGDFKDMRACNSTLFAPVKYFHQRKSTSTEYSFAMIPNQTQFNGTSSPSNIQTKARWVQWGLDESVIGGSGGGYANFVNLTLIHALNWIIQPHTSTTSDTTPPLISSLTNSTTTNQSVSITWTTNENANESNTLGVCPSFTGIFSNKNTTLGTSHIQAISSLSNSTNYCYNTTACDSSGNCASSNFSFTTRANQISIFADEAQGDTSIGIGVQNALLSSYVNYTEQLVSARNINNNQFSGAFDWMAKKANKVWLFNYVTNGESHVANTFNMTPSVYVLQIANLTQTQITLQVESLINSTK